jgi:hypothetical protein
MKIRSELVFAATIAAAATVAAANPMPVGSARFHPSHTAATPATEYSLSGHGANSLVDSMSSAWSERGFSGVVESWVYNNNAGGLTFVYQFTVDPGSHRLARGTLDGAWNMFAITDAGSDSSGNGTMSGDPSWVEHIDGLGLSNGGVGIQFKDPSQSAFTGIAPGLQSALVWFETDAPRYTIGNVGVLNEGVHAGARALVPIPLPGTAAMALFGLAAIGLRRR